MPLGERKKQKQQIKNRFMLICNLGEQSEPPSIKTPGKEDAINEPRVETL
jgi:hypothetical protein